VPRVGVVAYRAACVPRAARRRRPGGQGTPARLAPARADRTARHTPRSVARQLVIVNLQRTPLDAKAAVRVFFETDPFMEALMAALGTPVPAFDLATDPCAAGAGDAGAADTGTAADEVVEDRVRLKLRRCARSLSALQGGAVAPKRDCPHILRPEHFAAQISVVEAKVRQPARRASSAPAALTRLASGACSLAAPGGLAMPRLRGPPRALVRPLTAAGCCLRSDPRARRFCCQCRTVGCSRYVKASVCDHARTPHRPCRATCSNTAAPPDTRWRRRSRT
jgi:hypothetical protein